MRPTAPIGAKSLSLRLAPRHEVSPLGQTRRLGVSPVRRKTQDKQRACPHVLVRMYAH